MREYITYGITLLTITNPLGAMALFSGLVANRPTHEQKAIAREVGVAVAVIIVVVTWAGAQILDFFGVVPAGLQAAGGIVLVLMGLSMMNSQTPRQKSTKRERDAASEQESVSVFPLAMPITIGPGAITTVILGTQALPTATDRLVLSGIGVALAIVIWITLHSAGYLAKVIGPTGIGVVTRIMGLLLTAIAFQMLAAGLGDLLPGLLG